jgi:hypothetical protein
MAKVKVIGPRDPKPEGVIINTTSRSQGWSRGLSPFVLGPCKLYNGFESFNMENAWQYCKVYKKFVGSDGNPLPEYFDWAISGWNDKRANRYPMGKGATPEYSYWDGNKLGYIEARKIIYIPLYARAVRYSMAYEKLKHIYKSNDVIYLWDFDGYDYKSLDMSLTDVLNCRTRSMGHAFVLARMLEKNT